MLIQEKEIIHIITFRLINGGGSMENKLKYQEIIFQMENNFDKLKVACYSD